MSKKLFACLVFTALSTAVTLSAQTGPVIPERAAEAIRKEVRHEILMLPFFDVFDDITYKVEGFQVTLMGQVTRPTLKSEAENVVRKIEGVKKVVNQIEVLPISPIDNGLRVQLFRAIYGFPALERYALPVVKPIRIIVNNGNVTLEGMVDSEADKNMATIRAKSVSGVFAVTNNLRVVK